MDAVHSRTSSEIQISQRIQPSCHLSDVVEDVVLPYDGSGARLGIRPGSDWAKKDDQRVESST